MELHNTLEVFIDLRRSGEDEPETRHVGSLRASFQGTSRVLGAVRFEYAPEYLADERRIALSPTLQLLRGPQLLEANSSLPDVFADTAPDDWGQSVIRETVNRKHPGIQVGSFDFLALAGDEGRVGALRYQDAHGAWVGQSEPGETGAGEMLVDKAANFTRIAQRFERHEATQEDIDTLGAAGSSLGGARPKVSINHEGKLWLLKLPSSRDWNTDTEAWETVALRIAQASGIRVPEHRLFYSREGGSSLLIERFDRDGDRRLHYMSAMTVLQAVPGSVETYEDLADALVDLGAPREDLRELFLRVAFNVLISNRDDHWRNHGFLFDNGWRLSPMFDVNPVRATSPMRSRPINKRDTPSDRQIALLLDDCDVYGLTPQQAAMRLDPLIDAVSRWREIARHCRISESEIGSMSSAFREDQYAVAEDFVEKHQP
ncbi:type II toxin-antitoxin system HipA family toxin [Leucobacter celer]|uniref:type II toxin-antitoxin system HipA family toxin n=1 Tax=Leucobacter celer TaxID=668625 RepID=UPI000949618C|nr:type II toxin-antitoxin system HipA family toxin [Leucobacter celer]